MDLAAHCAVLSFNRSPILPDTHVDVNTTRACMVTVILTIVRHSRRRLYAGPAYRSLAQSLAIAGLTSTMHRVLTRHDLVEECLYNHLCRTPNGSYCLLEQHAVIAFLR